MALRSKRVAFSLSLLFLLFLLLFFYSDDISSAIRSSSSLDLAEPLVPSSHVYVVSLPRRQDRRHQMEMLRKYLSLDWTYHDALHSESFIVSHVLHHVAAWRKEVVQALRTNQTDSTGITIPFEWPHDFEKLVALNHPLSDPLSQSLKYNYYSQDNEPLTCAVNDSIIIPYSPLTRPHQILTPARVACWYSHLTAIQKIANGRDRQVGIIFEDDIDMERNIRDRLGHVWGALPHDWDLVFLGRWTYIFDCC
jgi:hypothetical protein